MALLTEAIESVRSQTIDDWELFVFDDGASDEAARLVAGYGDERITHVRNERPLGPVDNASQVLRCGSAPFLAILLDDDVMFPEHLQRLKDEGVDFSKIRGLSGAGMQHGTVFWSKEAESLLASLDSSKTLLEQLSNEQKSAFAHPHSPNWQDASTQQQCDKFDVELKDPETLAEITGSKAHHVRIPSDAG